MLGREMKGRKKEIKVCQRGKGWEMEDLLICTL